MLRTVDCLAACNAISMIFAYSWPTPEPKRNAKHIRKLQHDLIKFALHPANMQMVNICFDYTNSIQ